MDNNAPDYLAQLDGLYPTVEDPLTLDVKAIRAKNSAMLTPHEDMLLVADRDCNEAMQAVDDWWEQKTRGIYECVNRAAVSFNDDVQEYLRQEITGVSSKHELQNLTERVGECERRRSLTWMAYLDTLDKESRRQRSRSVCPECGTVFVPSKRGQIYDKRQCSLRAADRRRNQKERDASLISIFDEQVPISS